MQTDQLPQRVGAPLFIDQWPNAKVAKVAVMIGRGYSYQAIADALADGTTANQITALASFWKIAPKGERHTYAPVTVSLSGRHRSVLAGEAGRRGMELPELVAKIAETICRDGLFGAVLDT
jgi:hypothetical protein